MNNSLQEDLISMGYEVTQKSPYHFRIKKEECNDFVDFWPTTQKFVVNENGIMCWPAKYYEDIRIIAEMYLK